ncbi:MAG: hypothetical protein JO340_00165 [Acidobacteriaceae bacterium]|nr:hypothetical protein [Acidobacteriaceae bacterium]
MPQVANIYHKIKGPHDPLRDPAGDPSALREIVETFLKTCRDPALLEYGCQAVRLRPGDCSLEVRSGNLWIEAWGETRSVSRRILAIERRAPGLLDCTVHRFGGKPGKLTFLDLERPQTARKAHSGVRQSFAEQFRCMLFRQFPGWDIASLSCGLDLRRSFSSLFPRAHLAKGGGQIAALACPSLQEEPAMLTFALLWLGHLQQRSRAGAPVSLSLFLPDAAGNLTAHRLRWLTGLPLTTRIFRYNAHGSAGEVDPSDLGNLRTQLRAASPYAKLLKASSPLPSPVPPRDSSERSLEALVRSHPDLIEPSLARAPVHGQVLTFAAGDRDLIDLLAVSVSGRLAILELKTSEDIHLPIQALDYWMRIRWHAQRGELDHLFPGVPLAPALPKLLLVAPAMSFHSSNAAILRHFSPEIEVERVGINSDWQHSLKVVARLKGADAPISHGSFE